MENSSTQTYYSEPIPNSQEPFNGRRVRVSRKEPMAHRMIPTKNPSCAKASPFLGGGAVQELDLPLSARRRGRRYGNLSASSHRLELDVGYWEECALPLTAYLKMRLGGG